MVYYFLLLTTRESAICLYTRDVIFAMVSDWNRCDDASEVGYVSHEWGLLSIFNETIKKYIGCVP